MRNTAIAAGVIGAGALALAGCGPTISKAPVPAASSAASAVSSPFTPAPGPSSSAPLSGTIGTTFTVTSSDGTSYDVTLDKVTQDASLAPYETLDNSADHAAAAEFTITGDTGQSGDDANNDANVIGSDQTEYQPTFISLTVPNFNDGEFKVAPGETEKGWVAFEIPPGVKVARIQWAPGLSGSAATWNIGG